MFIIIIRIKEGKNEISRHLNTKKFPPLKGPVLRASSPAAPQFHGLLFHFYHTTLQLLAMFTFNDIYCIVLGVKGVLFQEH